MLMLEEDFFFQPTESDFGCVGKKKKKYVTCVLCSLQWTQSAGVRTILDWFWRAAAPTEPFLCWRSPATSSGTWRRLTMLTRWFTENTFVDGIQSEVWLTFSLHFSIVLCRLAATLSAGLRPCFREVWSTSPRPRNRTTSNALFLEAATTWSNCGSEFALCFFFLSFFFSSCLSPHAPHFILFFFFFCFILLLFLHLLTFTGFCLHVTREEDGQWKEDQKLEAHSDWVRDVGWAPSIGLPTSTIASCSQVRFYLFR